MNLFFLFIDYLIPILLLVSPPYWKMMAQKDIHHFSGIRTSKSMKNKSNWQKAHLLAKKYSFYLGVFLFFLTMIMRRIKLLPLEWNSLLLTSIDILFLIIMTIYINHRL
ncbi:MAG: SdpI family protein [Tissierellia bacterium]|nr:SdpI family protein [Tissierellia bacterium]